MTWLCNCGLVNGGTNEYCPGSLTWKDVGHYQVSANSPDWIMALLAAKELHMTPEEEQFAKFYNHEKLLIKGMNDTELREHRETLQKIAHEAKARVVAAMEEEKERRAKTKNKQWLVTDVNPNVTVSDAINVPKQRAARMSKLDRVKAQLEGMNFDPAIVKQMVSNMEKRATDQQLKTVTFTKPATEISAVRVKPNADAPPFDPSTLKFGDKK